MPDEVTTVNEVKTTSDGTVQIAVEKYNEMLEKIAEQKASLSRVNDLLTKARNEPPVIHRNIVEKTAEMAAEDNRIWGGTLMGLGAASFVVGALRYKAGRS